MCLMGLPLACNSSSDRFWGKGTYGVWRELGTSHQLVALGLGSNLKFFHENFGLFCLHPKKARLRLPVYTLSAVSAPYNRIKYFPSSCVIYINYLQTESACSGRESRE